MTPASATATLSSAETLRIEFIRRSDNSKALPSGFGVAPPTIEVLPPCGMMASPCFAQSFTQTETSAVEAGRSTASASPR